MSSRRIARLGLALLSLLGAVAPVLTAQTPTGLADVDSALAARAAWRRGQTAARARDDTTALRELARAANAWPTQPAYVLGYALYAARAGDTTAMKRALTAYGSLGLGVDLRGDSMLARYAGRSDFAGLLATHDRNRAPLVHSRVVATLPDSTTWPEGMTHDAATGRWYVGSVRHRTIVELAPDGSSRELWPRNPPDVGAVLALRFDAARHVIWATTSGLAQMDGYTPADSAIAALLEVRPSDGAILRRWNLKPIAGGHTLGDVALGASGDVYFSDSSEPVLYRLPRGAEQVERISSPHFRSLQGIAPSADGRAVYVADYSHGIMRLDLRTGDVIRVADAPRSTSLGCDGIVWYRGSIIAIQNGVSPTRVVRFVLDPSGTRFVRAEVLDRNAVADEPTIGEIVGNDFVYVANSQWEKHKDDGTVVPGARLAPPVLLAVPLSRR
jgi:sugar lactone lactonase YvrE